MLFPIAKKKQHLYTKKRIAPEPSIGIPENQNFCSPKDQMISSDKNTQHDFFFVVVAADFRVFQGFETMNVF